MVDNFPVDHMWVTWSLPRVSLILLASFLTTRMSGTWIYWAGSIKLLTWSISGSAPSPSDTLWGSTHVSQTWCPNHKWKQKSPLVGGGGFASSRGGFQFLIAFRVSVRIHWWKENLDTGWQTHASLILKGLWTRIVYLICGRFRPWRHISPVWQPGLFFRGTIISPRCKLGSWRRMGVCLHAPVMKMNGSWRFGCRILAPKHGKTNCSLDDLRNWKKFLVWALGCVGNRLDCTLFGKATMIPW